MTKGNLVYDKETGEFRRQTSEEATAESGGGSTKKPGRRRRRRRRRSTRILVASIITGLAVGWLVIGFMTLVDTKKRSDRHNSANVDAGSENELRSFVLDIEPEE